MTIISSFEAMFYRIYRSQTIPQDDFDGLLEYYFPSIIEQHKTTPVRDLAKLFGYSAQKWNTTVERFEKLLVESQAIHVDVDEVIVFRQDVQRIYDQLTAMGGFASLRELAQLLGLSRSLAGVFRLGNLLRFSQIAQTISINGQGYIVPNNISEEQMASAISAAKAKANFYGSVYPYAKLNSLPEWQFVPDLHILRFAKELLASDNAHFNLGDGDFFGFSDFGRDRIQSRLAQIYSVYDYVPDENLVNSLYRSIKKRVLHDKENDITILDECAEVFDEYCLRMSYCEPQGNLRVASAELKAFIKENHPNEKEERKMYDGEVALANAIRSHGKPMHTDEFVKLVDVTGVHKSHVMEYATLIYRTGIKKNSTYHTLDDRYEIPNGNVQILKRVDRYRVEVNQIIRNIRWAKRIKRLCENRCQICGERIQIGEDEYYSEAHHIQPIGEPHNGPDDINNMLCVCPNHHVMLDYGVIFLEIANLKFLDKNPVAQDFINYHNQNIYEQS